jgi:hypothetical protein
MLLLVDQLIQLVRKASRQTSRSLLVLPPSASQCQVRYGLFNRRLSLFYGMQN